MFKPLQLTPEHEEVQQVKKVRPYTVLPIKNIEEYRKGRNEFEAKWCEEYLKREALKRQIAHNAVDAQDAKLTFSEAEQAEIEYRATRDDDYLFQPKQKYTPGKWSEQNAVVKLWADGVMQLLEEPPVKLTVWERIKLGAIKFISLAFEK